MDRSRTATRRRFDAIAEHFASTRHHPWPEVTEFLADAPPAAVGLDLGCANGRHLPPLSERVDRAIGVDLSRELLAIARDDEPDLAAVDLLVGDASALPLASECVGLAVYVATLHHLPTRDARLASLDDLARVLEPGAPALVSAWSTAADRFADGDDAPGADATTGFDTTIDWELPDGETVPRFYHVYAPAEFERDLAASDLVLRNTEVSSGNCYATVAGPPY